MSTVIRLRKDAALAAFAATKPGGSKDPRDIELELLNAEVARLTEAIKEQAIELSLVREIALGLTLGEVPSRVPGEVKEGC